MSKYVIRAGVHYGTVDEMVNRIEAITAERDDLKAKLAEAVKTLEFYADRTFNGYDINESDYGISMTVGEIIKDGGDHARATIAKMTGGKDE